MNNLELELGGFFLKVSVLIGVVLVVFIAFTYPIDTLCERLLYIVGLGTLIGNGTVGVILFTKGLLLRRRMMVVKGNRADRLDLNGDRERER